MKKIFLLLIILLYFIVSVFGQTSKQDSVYCLRLKAVEDSKRFEDKIFFKFFALLLQDTCASTNRFTNYFYHNQPNYLQYKEYYYKAIIIDSTLAILAEASLKKIDFNLKRYVRLYIGFLNDERDTCIVVQFIRLKEYKKRTYYSKQMDLIAQKNRKLLFAILRKEEDKVIIESIYRQ